MPEQNALTKNETRRSAKNDANKVNEGSSESSNVGGNESLNDSVKKKALLRLAVAGVITAAALGGLWWLDQTGNIKAETAGSPVQISPAPIVPAPIAPTPISPAPTEPAPQAELGELPTESETAPASEENMPTTAAEEKIPAKKITETPTPKAEKPPVSIRPPISDEKKASGPTPIRESAPQIAPKPTAKPLPPPQTPPRQQPAFPSSPLPTAEIPATASMPLPGVATPIAPSFPPKQMLGKNYVVQLGVFNDTEAAKELIEKLNKAGIRAHLETRVQIGPFNSRKEAEKAQAEMRKLGYKALVTLPYPTR